MSPDFFTVIVALFQIPNVGFALQTLAGDFAVDADILHQRLERDIVELRPDITQNQQIQRYRVKVRHLVEFHLLVGRIRRSG